MHASNTPLDGLHRELGAKLVDFAGYALPMHYPAGIKEEHRHTRRAAGFFDVSHMGQIEIHGSGRVEALEGLVPSDIAGLPVGGQRYTVLTNEQGGIIDDVIVTNRGSSLALVVNAANTRTDLAYLEARLGGAVRVIRDEHSALVALQGPLAEVVLATLHPGVAALGFMHSGVFELCGTAARVSRCGYTGGDGFEISVPDVRAEALARRLLEHEMVLPAGLGARDGLRLEAGLCLYGHELTATTTLIEAGLGWLVAARHRRAGRAGFPGAECILRQLRDGAPRRRVGLRLPAGAIARAGAPVSNHEARRVGEVTSGGYSPELDCPIAMAYLETAACVIGGTLCVEIRGRGHAVEVVTLPFVEHRYAHAAQRTS